MGRHSLPELPDPEPTPTEEIPVLTAAFWTGALDRALKSLAQTLLLLWGADQGFDLLQVDWKTALGLAGGAALLSVLTSIVSSPVGDKGSSSFLPGAA